MQDGDVTFTDTALRETKEELGINPDRFSVWGCLPAMLHHPGLYKLWLDWVMVSVLFTVIIIIDPVVT